MRSIPLLLMVASVSACTAAPPVPRTAAAQAQLNQLLAGRIAGAPQSCLPPGRNDNMITIDENTILFRSGGTLYRNDLRGGGCNRLGGSYALVTRTTGSSLCSGDIAQVADLSTGVTLGSCVLGDFVPYRMP
jgi:hypothetical protein